MSKRRRHIIITLALAAFLVSGTLWARTVVIKKGDNTVRIDADDAVLADLSDLPGLALFDELPLAAMKTVMEQNLKFRKETKELRNQVEETRSELDLLWLEDAPSADRIVAKMRELDRLELELCEKEVRQRFATAQLLPEEVRADYLKEHGHGLCSCWMSGPGALHKALQLGGIRGDAGRKYVLKLKKGLHGLRCEEFDCEEDD
jgi:hypothetical protein